MATVGIVLPGLRRSISGGHRDEAIPRFSFMDHGKIMVESRRDIAQLTLSVLFIAALIGASLWVLSPFLLSLAWASTLVIATWPVMLGIQRCLWGSRIAAVATMTVLVIAGFLFPFWLALATILDNSTVIANWTGSLATAHLEPPPDWISDLPLIGSPIAKAWREISLAGPQGLLEKARPYAGPVMHWLVSAAGGIGATFLQFLLTAVLSAIMYMKGELAASTAIRFGRRLAGARGEQSMDWRPRPPRRGAWSGGHGARSGSHRRSRTCAGECPIRSFADRCPVHTMHCANRTWPRARANRHLDVRDGSNEFRNYLAIAAVLSLGIDNVIRPVLIRRGAISSYPSHSGRCDRRAPWLRIDWNFPRPDHSRHRSCFADSLDQ